MHRKCVQERKSFNISEKESPRLSFARAFVCECVYVFYLCMHVCVCACETKYHDVKGVTIVMGAFILCVCMQEIKFAFLALLTLLFRFLLFAISVSPVPPFLLSTCSFFSLLVVVDRDQRHSENK